jgi:hypothetical protein
MAKLVVYLRTRNKFPLLFFFFLSSYWLALDTDRVTRIVLQSRKIKLQLSDWRLVKGGLRKLKYNSEMVERLEINRAILCLNV